MNYRGYEIIQTFDQDAKSSGHHWEFIHTEYSGCDDNRWGLGKSVEDCKEKIDQLVDGTEPGRGAEPSVRRAPSLANQIKTAIAFAVVVLTVAMLLLGMELVLRRGGLIP